MFRTMGRGLLGLFQVRCGIGMVVPYRACSISEGVGQPTVNVLNKITSVEKAVIG